MDRHQCPNCSTEIDPDHPHGLCPAVCSKTRCGRKQPIRRPSPRRTEIPGVIHRDIKPDNVLLDDETGRALLTDFGVAKALGSSETVTRFGTVVGTPHFMSPEQAAGDGAVDARSDIYSLGVMAYAMLAGRLPFEGHSPADVLSKHLTQEPPSLRSMAPAVRSTPL